MSLGDMDDPDMKKTWYLDFKCLHDTSIVTMQPHLKFYVSSSYGCAQSDHVLVFGSIFIFDMKKGRPQIMGKCWITQREKW